MVMGLSVHDNGGNPSFLSDDQFSCLSSLDIVNYVLLMPQLFSMEVVGSLSSKWRSLLWGS